MTTDIYETVFDDILIVDDNPSNLELLVKILRDGGYKIRQANNGELALKSIEAKLPSLILLDVKMPEMDGFEVCRVLKANEKTRSIPIIFISALEDAPSKVQGFQVGGVDYIAKPFQKEEVLARVKTHCEFRKMQLTLQSQNISLLNEISNQRGIEKVLLESEERFKMLFEKAPLGYQSLDINGCFIEVNETWSEILGYSKEEVLGKWFGDFLSPKYAQGFRERFPIFKSLGKIHSEFEMVKRDGSMVFIAFDGRIGYTRSGEFKQTHCVLNDVTESRRVENELIASQKKAEKSEEKFRRAVLNAPFPIMIHTEDGIVDLVNDEWLKVTGYTSDEISTTVKWTERAYGIQKEMVLGDIEKLYGIAEKIDEGEYVISTKSGENRNWYFSSAPLGKNEAGKRIVMSMASDFTDLKRTQESIRLDEMRLESLLRINQFSTDNIQELLDYALEEVISLTSSKIGYIYLYDEVKKEFTLNTWSKEVMHECSVLEPETKYMLENTGIWGEAVRQGKPILVNDFAMENHLKKGTPEGHVQLRKFLTIPVINGVHIVAVVGVANKTADYDNSDIRQLNLMMDAVWKIVERKKAENALQESERKFRNLFDNSPIGKSMTGIDGSLHTNQAFCNMVGYSEEELRTKHWEEISFPDDIQETNRYIKMLLDGNISRARFEKRYVHKNGKIVWADVSTYLQHDKDERPEYFITAINDISERKKMEEALFASEMEFRTLAESMPQIVWITRADGWNIYFNQQWVNYTGLTLEESYGHGWNIPFHPEDQQRTWDA